MFKKSHSARFHNVHELELLGSIVTWNIDQRRFKSNIAMDDFMKNSNMHTARHKCKQNRLDFYNVTLQFKSMLLFFPYTDYFSCHLDGNQSLAGGTTFVSLPTG